MALLDARKPVLFVHNFKKCKKYEKQNFIMACIAVLISCQCIAQTFSGESSVITYASGKVFSNPEKTVRIEITYDGIKVNGNLTYFNLEISVLNSSVALIKGYSLSNPDGTISFRLNSSTGCIIQGSDSYCSTNSTQINKGNSATIKDRFNEAMPAYFSEEGSMGTMNLGKNGVGGDKGFARMRAGEIKSWIIKNENDLELTIIGIDGKEFKELYKIVFFDNNLLKLSKSVNGKVIYWKKN